MTGTLAFALLLFAAAGLAAEPLTSMPPYPTDPSQYRSKWDPFHVKALAGTKETLSVNNGRQIARDSSGAWFVLAEKDRQAIFLGWARAPRVAGSDLEMLPLVGADPEAVFPAEGELSGAGMVIDAQDRLHVTWCAGGALFYASRPVRGATAAGLRDRAAWSAPRRLAEPPCHPGDLMLDARGRVALCFSREDTVFYLPAPDGRIETAGGVGAGMPPLVMPRTRPADDKPVDPAAPAAPVQKRPSYPPPRPLAERECRSAVMDISPDGSVHLAFQRDFDIWHARRTPEGRWLPPERAAWGLAFHPSLVATADGPLICYQFQGIRSVAPGSEEYLLRREGGGSSIGYAFRRPAGWRTDWVAKAEEILVNRQGIWDKRYEGKLLPAVEEMWRPALFRDRHGVPWALWQNTTRRWAYCARWLGDGFGDVQECRGPFDGAGQPVSAEKVMPAGAADVGVLFLAGNRILFDRLKIPTLSLGEEREILFLDALEIGQTRGACLVLNQMEKHPTNPILSPGPLGSRDDRHVFSGRFRRHGPVHVLYYSFQSWDDADWRSNGIAISRDGIRWERVDRLPADLPPPSDAGSNNPLDRGYYDNPDTSDPAKRYFRIDTFGPGWVKGSKRIRYSPDGKQWTDGPEISVTNAVYEGATLNLFDPLDLPERRFKIYGRVFSVNSRSCGVMWSGDLLHWEGAEHFLDPDDPYGKPPGQTSIGPMRGQVFLDACAGKGEDQIYSCQVRIEEGLYVGIYWPCTFEHRYEGALIVSRDGLNFTRVKNGERTLPVGTAGAWDSGIIKLSWPQRDGDVLRAYYGGSAWHHGVEPYRPAWHVGLATLRANGWTYFTPAPETHEATVTTIPIAAPAGAARQLAVNVEGAAGRNAFAVEVLDAATGQPLRGFTAGDCLPVKDGVAAPVRWKGGGALPVGKTLRVRFHLHGKNVRLYSFGFHAPAKR